MTARVVPVVAYMPESTRDVLLPHVEAMEARLAAVFPSPHPGQPWTFEQLAWGRLLGALAEAIKSGEIDVMPTGKRGDR